MELWEALAARKKEIGIKYEELSEKADIPVNTLKKIFTGRIEAPSFESIRAIAYAMGLTLDDLDKRIEETGKQSEEERELIGKYRELTPVGKELIQTTMTFAMKHHKAGTETFLTGRTVIGPGGMVLKEIKSIDDPTLFARHYSQEERKELEKEMEHTPVE